MTKTTSGLQGKRCIREPLISDCSPEHSIELTSILIGSQPAGPIAETLISIGELVKYAGDLIVFPDVALKILSLSNDPDIHLDSYSNLVCQDAGLASGVLRLANNRANYQTSATSDIHAAISRIGLVNLRSLVLSLSLPAATADLNNPIIELNDYWNNSLRIATLAAAIGEHVPRVDPSQCFTAGLIVDIGQLVLVEHYPKTYSAVLSSRLFNDSLSICEAEEKRFGYNHQDVGKALASAWGFPAPLVNCIAMHHEDFPDLEAGLTEIVVYFARVLGDSLALEESTMSFVENIPDSAHELFGLSIDHEFTCTIIEEAELIKKQFSDDINIGTVNEN